MPPPCAARVSEQATQKSKATRHGETRDNGLVPPDVLHERRELCGEEVGGVDDVRRVRVPAPVEV